MQIEEMQRAISSDELDRWYRFRVNRFDRFSPKSAPPLGKLASGLPRFDRSFLGPKERLALARMDARKRQLLAIGEKK